VTVDAERRLAQIASNRTALIVIRHAGEDPGNRMIADHPRSRPSRSGGVEPVGEQTR
jgi:hypothetical protein